MNKKLLELQAKLAELKKQQEARLTIAQSENPGDLTALLAEVETGNKDIESVANEIATVEKLQSEIAARAKSKPSGQITVENNGAKKPWTGLGEFLMAVRAVEVNGRVDERLASGMGEAVGSEGGFAVGTDMSSMLIQQAYQTGEVTRRCTNIPISANSNAVELPAMDDKDRTNGKRWGGVTAYWTSEAATIPQANTAPLQKIKLGLNKLAALVYMTDELLADQTAMQAWVDKTVPSELAFKIEDSIYRGTGAGQPFGFLSSTASLVTQAAEAAQTAGTVNLANVTKMYSRMPARLKPNSVWLINSEVFPQLQLMTSAATSASQMVYLPPGGASSAPYGTLFGRPIIEVEYASGLGTVGDIAYVNLGEYLLAQKGGVQQDVSIHVKFLTDETAFRFIMRIDGKPAWTSTITPFKGSNVQSPFVVLAAR